MTRFLISLFLATQMNLILENTSIPQVKIATIVNPNKVVKVRIEDRNDIHRALGLIFEYPADSIGIVYTDSMWRDGARQDSIAYKEQFGDIKSDLYWTTPEWRQNHLQIKEVGWNEGDSWQYHVTVDTTKGFYTLNSLPDTSAFVYFNVDSRQDSIIFIHGKCLCEIKFPSDQNSKRIRPYWINPNLFLDLRYEYSDTINVTLHPALTPVNCDPPCANDN